MKRRFRVIFPVVFGVLSFFGARAQKVYFIYIQSEQEQPFFVRMDEKIYSANPSGYLILSRLRDSTYNFSIGFPDNRAPEQRFSLYLNRRDHGYLLRHFEGRGWGLFDLQTMAVQMATAPMTAVAMEKKDVSRFTDLLSRAADDSTLKEKPVLAEQKKPEVKPEPTVSREEPSTPVAKVDKNPKDEIKKEEVRPEPVVKRDEPQKTVVTEIVQDDTKKPDAATYKPSTISKVEERETSDGVSVIYIDQFAEGSDTVRILIPARKPVVEPVKEQPREEKRFLEISTDTLAEPNKPVIEEKKPAVEENKPVVEEKKPVVEENKVVNEKPVPVTNQVRNNCSAQATESDFFKLRKKMAGESNDYDMIDEARKIFRGKCFSVQQVRNLSALFLTDLGKYMFFDAFYGFVSDPENYPSLQSELREEYYINRFRAMLRN